jgi:hypothetical protein
MVNRAGVVDSSVPVLIKLSKADKEDSRAPPDERWERVSMQDFKKFKNSSFLLKFPS